MGLRQRCQKLDQATKKAGIMSVRALAKATDLSKSSVHRLCQKIKGRSHHPESSLWETPEGYQWLRLLVFATIYIFGIKHGVGSEALSEFFELVRLKSQIGISPTALRRLELQMRSQILAYGEQQHQEVKLTKTKLEILAGADETFFPGMNGIILVLMDLVSGYIILEKKTSNRKYQTWFDQVQTALMDIGQLGAIKSLVSDRAKALIQLAVKGMGCQSIPDLFHAMRFLSRSMGVRLGGNLARTKKKLQKTQAEITLRHLAKKPISSRLSQRKSWLQQEYQFIQTGLDTYREYIHQITTLVHPFVINENKIQNQIYQKAREKAHQKLLTDPFTRKLKKKEINQWQDWSTLMVSRFQRATSAIEGRNGYLSRLHHNGRGLSEKDLQVLTVIHNYDLHRADGSTAAQRFFGRTFPPLFSWVFEQMGDLPASRKSRKFRNVSVLVA